MIEDPQPQPQASFASTQPYQPKPCWTSNLRILLVRPSEPGNIGSACRALCNFGFQPNQLLLVQPLQSHLDAKAAARAGQADYWLKSLAVHNSLDTALQGCAMALGTTAIQDALRRRHALSPRNAVEQLRLQATHAPVALLFGNETAGLDLSEQLRCDALIHIPVSPAYTSINLAVAVAILAYECSLTLDRPSPRLHPREAAGEQPAPAELMQILHEQWFTVAEQVGFFNPQSPWILQMGLRGIFGRLRLSVQEARILLGLARQVLWYVHNRTTPGPPAAPPTELQPGPGHNPGGSDPHDDAPATPQPAPW